jgi:hypothetical protein
VKVGNLLIVAGIGLVVVGIAVRLGFFGWFGNLPGDIRIDGGRSRVFIPITSMLIVSVVASVVLNLAGRWMGGE